MLSLFPFSTPLIIFCRFSWEIDEAALIPSVSPSLISSSSMPNFSVDVPVHSMHAATTQNFHKLNSIDVEIYTNAMKRGDVAGFSLFEHQHDQGRHRLTLSDQICAPATSWQSRFCSLLFTLHSVAVKPHSLSDLPCAQAFSLDSKTSFGKAPPQL